MNLEPTVTFLDDRMSDRERRLREAAADALYEGGDPNPGPRRGSESP